MSRPTKYNQETTSEFLKLVEEGYTVKLACKKTGITDMTLSRWKKRYPDFLEALNKATSKQWANIDNLHRSGIRVYKRKADKLSSSAEKPLESGLNASQSHSSTVDKPQLCEGLRVRHGSIVDDEPYTPCVNPKNGMVEYLKRQNGRDMEFFCTIDAFRRGNPAWYQRLVAENSTLANL